MSFQPSIWGLFYKQSFAARNLSTAPLTVGGLRGDLYDYKLIVVSYGVGSNACINVRPNGDAGTNYRRYRLYAGGATINVEKNDTACSTWIINTTGTNASHSAAFVGEITGRSGAERVMSFIWGNNYDATYYAQQGVYWWKNTADELTSLVFHSDENVAQNFTITILQKPKLAQDAEWELVDRKTLNSTNLSNGVFFSGLDGDRDEEYLLRGCFTASAADASLNLRFNGDAGSNYAFEYLRNQGGTASAYGSAAASVIPVTVTAASPQPCVFEARIKAKSGVCRPVFLTCGGSGTYNANGMYANWWLNTADKLEQVNVHIYESNVTATGHVELYRKGKSVSASKPAFETLKTVDVDGEFSQGYTFDLAGLGIADADAESMLVLEYHGVSKTAGQTNMFLTTILNGDTGNNYSTQWLYGDNSSAVAWADGAWSKLMQTAAQPLHPCTGKIYLFPKSGKYRPALGETAEYRADISAYRVETVSTWWLNTADKLRSIKVYATSAGNTQFKGRITLKRLVAQ